MITTFAPQRRASEAGFSLMEAIVAVAILGIASVPLLVLQSQNARSVSRLENSAERIAIERVAHDYLSVVDTASASAGVIDMGAEWTLNWQAVPVGESEAAVMSVGQRGRYSSRLLRIGAVMVHSDGRQIATEIYRHETRELFPYRAF